MTKTLDLRRAERLETLMSHERKRGRTGTSRGKRQGKMVGESGKKNFVKVTH